MQLGLLITNRCNAACSHCATSCGPQRHDSLSEADLLRIMGEAAIIHRENNSGRLEFCISGGEPFLDLVLLEKIVSFGASLGGIVACQTNAFWASNDDKAQQVLDRMKKSGMVSMGVSVSRFHDPFIRRSRIERALKIARQMSIETTLKCALTADDAELEAWARNIDVDRREIFPVHPYLRDGARLNEGTYRTMESLPKGRCPASVLTLREDGQAYTCCSPGGFNKFLRLGDIRSETLHQLNDHFHAGGRQQVLRQHGPAYFAQEITRRGEGGRLRGRYADVCDLCCHIGSDRQMSDIASSVSSDFEMDQVRNLFIRFAEGRRADEGVFT